MTSTVFSLQEVKELVTRAREAARPTGAGFGDSLEERLGRVDPLRVVAAFPCLHLRSGWTLYNQRFTDGANAIGHTWGFQAGSRPPRPIVVGPEGGPPFGSVPAMFVIDGDGTPWSYLCASLLARELAELGARWHGCSWVTHELYDGGRLPEVHPFGQWQNLAPRPERYDPTVTRDEQGTTVTFYTYSGLVEHRVTRHVDLYRANTAYQATADNQVIARAPGGFRF